MNNNIINQKYDLNSKDVLKEIYEQPNSYLISYFDHIKTKVDLHFEKILADTSDNELKQSTSNEWVKIVDVIEKCRIRCLNNTLSCNLIEEIKKCQSSQNVVKEMKNKINSCLLANDSYFVCSINIQSSEKQIIVEEGLTNTEIKALIECFKNKPFEFKFNKIDKSEFNFVKMIPILEEISVSNKDLIYIESITNRNEIAINFKPVDQRNFYSSLDKFPLFKLEPKYFESFSALKSLSIGYVDFYDLNCDTFKYLPNLKALKLRDITVKDFKFKRINKLESHNESIELECLELNSITTKCNIMSELENFNGLKSLKSLTLICCDVKELNENFFINLKNLEEFNISYNQGLCIKEGCFKSLSKLRSLNLTGYEGINLGKSLFSGLSNLEILVLKSTRFSVVEKGCFDELVNLKSLDLMEFSLKKPRQYHDRESFLNSRDAVLIFCKLGSFAHLRKLQHLNLNYVECLGYKSNSFANLENLETLCLVQSKNADFQVGCFNRLKNLKSIDLSDSGFLSLSKDLFKGLDNLESLDFESTSLELEVGCFNGLPRLKKLNLAVCNLDLLKKNVFAELLNLETLNLNANQVKLRLEEGCFNGLKNLKELNLSMDQIKNLEKNILIELESLEVLNLSSNKKISFKMGCFKSLKNLKKLDLSYCDISKLKKWLFEDLINLESLDLSNNHDLYLDDDLLEELKKLKNFSLGSKPKHLMC